MTRGLMLLSVLACATATMTSAQTRTLREILIGDRVPTDGLSVPAGLNRVVTSYATESAPDLFVIAYYTVGANPRDLEDSLRVSTFDRSVRIWTHAVVERSTLGAVLAIHHTARHVFLDTHINPSAGTLIVLSRSLNPVTRLDGWLLRILPVGVVLYHKNEIHFAPTHSAELWTWNETTGRNALLYPAKPYGSVRCRYVNSHIGDTILVNSAGTAAAFIVHFGEGNQMPADPPPLDVVVACHRITSTPACTERELVDIQRAHAGWTTIQILNDLVGNPMYQVEPGTHQTFNLVRMIQSRARFRVNPADPWRYGMLNATRTPTSCFMLQLFGQNRRLLPEVWLDSVTALEISRMFNGSRAWDDWTDTLTHPGETWMPVAKEIVDAAVTRCRRR